MSFLRNVYIMEDNGGAVFGYKHFSKYILYSAEDKTMQPPKCSTMRMFIIEK